MKLRQDFSNYHDQINYFKQSGTNFLEKDSFSKTAEGIAMIMQEVMLLMKFLQKNLKSKMRTQLHMTCTLLSL